MNDGTKLYTVSTKGINNEFGDVLMFLYPTYNCYTMENDTITIEIECREKMTLTIKQAKKLVKQLNKIIKSAERYGEECE